MAQAFRIVGKGRLEEQDASKILAGVAAKGPEGQGDPHWIDLTSPSDEELTKWFNAYHVPPFLRELTIGTFPLDALGDQLSASLVSDDGAYFFLPFYGSEDCSAPERLVGVCTHRALITYHPLESPALEAAKRLAQDGEVVPHANLSGLLAVLLRFVANRNLEAVALLRKRAGIISKLLTENYEVTLDEILELEGQVDTLGAAVDEQLATVRALSVGNAKSLPMDGIHRHISVTITNLDMLARALDRLDRHVGSLRSQYNSMLNERTNHRLTALTVLSAVFMPLTLIAGIYGMNFDAMPELHSSIGYPVTLVAMAVIAGAMLIFFWKRGWFE